MPRYEPKVGHIVLYRLTPANAEEIGNARQAFAHKKGTKPSVGGDVPLVVTAVWASRVISGQGILDGNDSIWIPQVGEGTGIGQWRRQE